MLTGEFDIDKLSYDTIGTLVAVGPGLAGTDEMNQSGGLVLARPGNFGLKLQPIDASFSMRIPNLTA